MDIISMGKASQALKQIQALDTNVVAPLAESRFPTVDARLDWLEQQAEKSKAVNSKQLDLTQGVFMDTEVSGGKLQLKKIGETGSGYKSDSIPSMTSNNTPYGIASASDYDNNGTSYWEPWRAFNDQDESYSWKTTNISTGWLAYEFSSPKKVVKYSLKPRNYTANNTAITMMPKDWIFEGFNGSVWVTLDSRLNIVDWVVGTTKEFIINSTNIGLYTKYRINVSSNNGHAALGIGEMEMMESAVAKTYSPTGTYESSILDCGEGWIETKIVDVVKQINVGSTDCILELSTSTDGTTFISYTSFDPAAPPQGRYVKIRATLSATPGAAEETSLDFNQSNPQHTFTLGEFAEANGVLKPKTTYVSSFGNPTPEGTGTVVSVTLDKSKFKKIEKVAIT